eukprot:g12434.t1
MASYDHLFKLLMVGDSDVGKTSLLLRFTLGEFKQTQNTVGVDLKVKMMDFENKRLKLTIWDTAGQERFRTLTSTYYRGAQGIVLVYDVTQPKSFESLKHWLQEIEIYGTTARAVIMLVGNKIDKVDKRAVSKQQGASFARDKGMLFLETSAKTDEGVRRAFEELLHKIMEVPSLLGSDTRPGTSSGFTVGQQDEEEQDDGQCAC